MPVRDILSRKLNYLRSRYGDSGAVYFEAHPVCEICCEGRLACLSLHHTDGKEVESFQTLCFNCHMVLHAYKSGSATYESVVAARTEKLSARKKRGRRIASLYHRGLSLRAIGRAIGLSHVAVKNSLERGD